MVSWADDCREASRVGDEPSERVWSEVLALGEGQHWPQPGETRQGVCPFPFPMSVEI